MNHTDRSSGYYIAEGAVFIILGIIALFIPQVLTLSLEMLFGWLFLFGGIIQAFRTFQTKDAPGFLFSLISSIFLLIAGTIMLAYPLSGAFTLTILLAFFFLFDGIAKLVWSIRGNGNRLLILFGALIEFALAYLIWKNWPVSGVIFLGSLVGVWMLYYGVTTLFYGFGHRNRIG
jgi:uncharacterized membrane protein HdeD (DUF308 family)